MQKNKKQKIKKEFLISCFSLSSKNGFVLPFAVIISSIILSMGLGIFNITIKELRLSSSYRESQLAFYASDTGGECAIYWDIKKRAFATSTILSASNVFCLNNDVTTNTIEASTPNSWIVSTTDTSSSAKFRINFTNGACADIFVVKNFNPPQTTIESRGYNTCDTNNSKRVERGLRIKY